jgi:hypothetical protein
MNFLLTVKSQLGCWLNERWKTEIPLRFGIGSWLDVCNRYDVLDFDTATEGRICRWQDSSALTVCRIFPRVAVRLFRHCFKLWPVRLNFAPDSVLSDAPAATVLIAIGGRDRLPQFWMTLASMRGQADVALEIIVVEQGPEETLRRELPADVRYIHDPGLNGQPFNKSRALNVGAREARGEFLLIHDGDFVVPCNYVSSIVDRLKSSDAIRPARFIFYLSRASSEEYETTRRFPEQPVFDYVAQNTPTPMAMKSSCYRAIGGHDESFIGWGGEDVEFLSRLRMRSIAEGGYLPVIHLWHPAAPNKTSGHRNRQLQADRLTIPAEQRIQLLKAIHHFDD